MGTSLPRQPLRQRAGHQLRHGGNRLVGRPLSKPLREHRQLDAIGSRPRDQRRGPPKHDIAIRLHRPNQSEMIQRKLFTVHNHFYASKSYLATHSAPQTVEDLDNHSIISFGEPVSSCI